MEKFIRFDSGSDMLPLQAFRVFADIPSTPVAFFELDFSMKDLTLSAEIHRTFLCVRHYKQAFYSTYT